MARAAATGNLQKTLTPQLRKSAALSNNLNERSKPSLGVNFNLNIVFTSKGSLWGPL